jgi:hypothetical protein
MSKNLHVFHIKFSKPVSWDPYGFPEILKIFLVEQNFQVIESR